MAVSLASGAERRVDDGEARLALDTRDLGDAEHGAQPAGRQVLDRARRGRGARRRLRERRRARGVEGTLPSTFCMTWWMCPFSTVTEPKRRSSASACAPSSVPQPHSWLTVQSGTWANTTIGWLAGRAARSLLQPVELLGAEVAEAAGLEVLHVVEADEVHALLVEAILALAAPLA